MNQGKDYIPLIDNKINQWKSIKIITILKYPIK